MTVAMRGRKVLHQVRSEYGKAIRKAYEAHKITSKRGYMQKYEARRDGLCNTITTVQKDNLYVGELTMEKTEEKQEIEEYLHKGFGVFKLTPRECLRLQGVMDADIDKMQAVNSNTQLYKQVGNSITVTVLMAIFSQLHIKGVPAWNELTQEQREQLLKNIINVKED